jgi:hypothetical protein
VRIAANGSEMKTIPIQILLLWIALLPAAFAQQKGIAEGRVNNLTDPSIVARNVDLEVLALGGGMSIIKSAVTDASGKFRIEGLPEEQALMVRANYKGANYHAMLTFSAGKATAEIGIYEPTTSMKDIRIEDVTIAFQLMGDRLRALETVTFNNKTNPPRTFVSPEGNFRISKPPGLLEPPSLRVTAPGSSMPLVQSALESADGKSYYSLYPLRPGATKFEVQLLLPYSSKSYRYVKTFYHGIESLNIGVIPQDMALSGQGLSKVQTDAQQNFSVYASAPINAGAEIIWEFSGGTPVPETDAESPAASGAAEVTVRPNAIGSNALIIGPMLMLGLILILWYAFNRSDTASGTAPDFHLRQLRERREQLLNHVADLDRRYEAQTLGEQEYKKQREDSKQQLRRISLLLKK